MRKTSKILLVIIFSVMAVGLVAPLAVHAVDANTQAEIQRQMGAAGGTSGLGTPVDPRIIAANIIRVLLGLLGMIFFSLTIYAGFLWMTAGGEDEKVTKAKSLLSQAVIGLVIVLSAFSITLFATKLALGSYSQTYQESELLGPGWLERLWITNNSGQ